MLIELCNIHFFAYHGCFPEERSRGNDFSVDVKIHTEDYTASETDNLSDTVDYGFVYNLIKQEMMHPSNLLEHLVGRIHRVLTREIPTIEKLTVTVRKYNPPIEGNAEYAAVTISF